MSRAPAFLVVAMLLWAGTALGDDFVRAGTTVQLAHGTQRILHLPLSGRFANPAEEASARDAIQPVASWLELLPVEAPTP